MCKCGGELGFGCQQPAEPVGPRDWSLWMHSSKQNIASLSFKSAVDEFWT